MVDCCARRAARARRSRARARRSAARRRALAAAIVGEPWVRSPPRVISATPKTRKRALEGTSAVADLAAIVGDPACAAARTRRKTNWGTKELLRERAGRRRAFVFASTCSNYGKMSGADLANEDVALLPVWLYAETKVGAEREVLTRRGLTAPFSGFATVYGTSPRMRFDLTQPIYPRPRIQGELDNFGEQFWRPYFHVRDVASAIAPVLESPTGWSRAGLQRRRHRRTTTSSIWSRSFASGSRREGSTSFTGTGSLRLPRQLREVCRAHRVQDQAIGRKGDRRGYGACSQRTPRPPLRSRLPEITAARRVPGGS